MRAAAQSMAKKIEGIFGFLGVIWAVYLVHLVIPSMGRFGLVPRTLGGLIGIAAMPFLHESFSHLLSNSVPLFILLVLLARSRARFWRIVVGVGLLSGFLLWVVGRPAIHIGASGLVFGLITYLIVSGLIERRVVSLLVAAGVGFLYGGVLVFGIVPGNGPDVSWDGHLCGAVAGMTVAFAANSGERRGVRRIEKPVL
jgi:membrane associated rhomboid family serine protease